MKRIYAACAAASLALFLLTRPAVGQIEVADWRRTDERGWLSGAGAERGETLRLRTTSREATASLSKPPAVGPRFAVEFSARFHRLGLDDNGTGEKTGLRLSVGVKAPGGPFGVGFRFSGDRYEVDGHSKIFRTDEAWHRWRFEIDTTRRTVAMYRDGVYVCLHDAGSRQPSGVHLRVTGVPDLAGDVEIGRFSLQPLEPVDALSNLHPLPAKTDEVLGEWRMWRRDERNTGASDLRGAIRTPRIAWSYPVGRMAPAAVFFDLDGDGVKEALVSHGGNLTAYRLDGSRLWKMRGDGATLFGVFDLAGDGRRGPVIASGTPSQFQVLDPPTGKLLYACPEFPRAGVVGVRLARLRPGTRGLQAVVWSPQNEIGFCLSFDKGIENARVVWRFNWRVTNFSPTVALADMDRDGALDVVVVTYDRTFVFDGRNGRTKMDYRWPSGRNYGISVIRDIDGDGFPDLVVLADYLREHIAVVKNEGGKTLRRLWDRFYEQDYPDDDKTLRLLTESVDDFDGDGKLEIAGALYDGTADKTWHTFLLDARTGAVKQDLPGLCLIAAGPVFPGQPPSLIVSRPDSRADLQDERLTVLSGQGGTLREAASLPAGALLTRSSLRDFAPEVWSTHLVNTAAIRSFGGTAGLFIAHPASAGGDRAVVFLAGLPDGRLEVRGRLAVPPGFREAAVSARERPHATRLLKQHERAGRALDVEDLFGTGTPQLIAADESGALQIVDADRRVRGTIRPGAGFVTLPVVARLRKSEPPRILLFDARGSLLCLAAPAGRGRPETLWSRPAAGSRPYLVPYLDTHGVPVIADTDGNGERRVLVSAAPNRLVALDAEGREARSWTLPDRPVQWLAGNFDGDGKPDLFVTYPTGAFLDMESAVLAGRDGSVLWKSHVGNGPPAAFDLNGDGKDDILLRDLFERRTLDGRTGRDILPTTLWAGYQTPVVLPLSGPKRPPGVAWVGGMYSLVAESPIGSQLWWHPVNSSLRDFGSGPQAVADIDGDGRYEIGGITAGQLYNWPAFYRVDGPDREFLCYDALTGKVNWRYPVGTTSSGVIAADVDGDGKAEFVFGTTDGRLIALRGGEDDDRRVLWEVSFPAALGQPVAADVDGDGTLSLLVSCADGNLYCVKG